MIAAALRYVDRVKGKNRYRFLRLSIHAFWLSAWLKPCGQGNPPLIGPTMKGMAQFRIKNGKALGMTEIMGERRKTRSNSPAMVRVRMRRHAYHSKAIEKG